MIFLCRDLKLPIEFILNAPDRASLKERMPNNDGSSRTV